jgi:hypothetical protein
MSLRRWECLSVLLGAIGFFAFSSPAAAVCTPDNTCVGGKPKAAGCYAVFNVQGGTASSNKVSCTDGDPSCDIGGPACQSDDTCNFMVRFCVNDTETAPACEAASIERVRSSLPSTGISFPVPSTSTDCGPYKLFSVKLKKGGKKPGKRSLRLSAVAEKGFKPKRETAHLFLVCNPRTDATPCVTTTTAMPPTTSTSTTTTVFSTTTTTSSTTTTTTIYGSPSRAFLGQVPDLLE